MNREELKKVLPYREPMLMPDQVEILIPGEKVQGTKKITENEFWCAGHFPENPVFPGVLLIETMAQTALILMGSQCDTHTYPVLARVEDMKFLHPCVPGDLLKIDAVRLSEVCGFWKIRCVAYLDNMAVAKGTITCCMRRQEK
ncbi:MAG: 3-hydroxyacyl-ACP dehydratase FabZ [Eubacteriales bacterium]|nr:3-hydroxyacyl-ACP dehydratase FabZ [Eubacteriales bacterium]